MKLRQTRNGERGKIYREMKVKCVERIQKKNDIYSHTGDYRGESLSVKLTGSY
jgi:hypothetical protein